jgi:hypothetical protein
MSIGMFTFRMQHPKIQKSKNPKIQKSKNQMDKIFLSSFNSTSGLRI